MRDSICGVFCGKRGVHVVDRGVHVSGLAMHRTNVAVHRVVGAEVIAGRGSVLTAIFSDGGGAAVWGWVDCESVSMREGMDTRTREAGQGELVKVQPTGGEVASPVVSRIEDVLRIRPGTEGDLKFVDDLQKRQSRELGFLPWKALEGKVKLGQVLVADVMGKPAGYLIASDRYMKRDEVGLITQVNVDPRYRRHLVAGALVQAQFDRSAYGCRLYSCWCAQDLEGASAF